MKSRTRVLVSGLVFTVVVGASYAVDATASDAPVLGPGLVTVDVGIEHSDFSIDTLAVRAGTTVRFVVHNDDPINHEFVTGDADVHTRHARGTERRHPPVPGEVSVGPGETRVTYFTFDEPGTYAFACHLPGHVDYGMQGEIRVRS